MTAALLVRTSRTLVRVPALVASPVLMSAFFLLVYAGQLGSAGGAMLDGASYLAFIVPLVLLTTAFNGGALAGQLLVRDMTSGYHRRLLLSRAGRARLVAAPLVVGGAVLAVQAIVIVGTGLALGMRPSVAEAAGLVLGTAVAGVGFSLLGAAAAVRWGTDAAVSSTVLLFFPLSFLTSAFAPRSDLSGWMGAAATVNPLTYVLEGLRAVGGSEAPAGALLPGVVTLAGLLAIGAAACAWAFRAAEAAR